MTCLRLNRDKLVNLQSGDTGGRCPQDVLSAIEKASNIAGFNVASGTVTRSSEYKRLVVLCFHGLRLPGAGLAIKPSGITAPLSDA